ncbi:MAG: hypothetical protein Q9191_002995 [Dirinaria sp. TL-2023a]
MPKGFFVTSLLFSVLRLSSASERKTVQSEAPSPFDSDFDTLVNQNLKHWHVPGFSIAIVDGNATFSKGYGVSSFPAQNVTPDTLFATASTTKAFTAAAFAFLVDDTRNNSNPLSWQTPISSLIRDDFVIPDVYATAHLTIEDALSHRTGMPRHNDNWFGNNFTVREVVRNLRHLPLTEEIRTKFQYCNMMYVTISHVIETLTGSWLGNVFAERIWKPLNMTHTFFLLQHAKEAARSGAVKLATPYKWNNVTQEFIELPWLDSPQVSGAGAIISTVVDYAKWLRFNMDKAPPLSELGHEALRTPRIFARMMDDPSYTGTQNYGLGWHLANFHGEPLISHFGNLPGFGTFIGYLPDKRYGIAMMGNSDGSVFATQILASRLLADRLDIPEKERFPRAGVFENFLQKEADKRRHPRKDLFPTAPNGSDIIPLSLPLEAYTGLYSNPGYHNITIGIASRSSDSPLGSFTQSILGVSNNRASKYLKSSLSHTWSTILEFEHVSGEFFIIRGYWDVGLKHIDYSDPFSINTYKAEFRIGENGKVSELGVLLEPSMGEEKIWFRKLE